LERSKTCDDQANEQDCGGDASSGIPEHHVVLTGPRLGLVLSVFPYGDVTGQRRIRTRTR